MEGNCIRCRCSIKQDVLRPFCENCHKEWLQSEQYFAFQKYCHACGTEAEVTFMIPICYDCNFRRRNTVD